MCGIIGFNWEDDALMFRALKKISHRGPDAHGKFTDGKVSLGHRRLSIIDLSKKGIQPMCNEDKSIWIIFNGEIYNYKELKNTLKKNHIFKSDTDTEVMLHLYEEVGEKLVNLLWGMFALCIYDTRKNKIFLARDRLGIKPLYYYIKNDKIIFASEIKAILELKEFKREVNPDALSSFLTFRANAETETFFKGIHKLAPGSFLSCDLKKKSFNISKYWKLKISPESLSEKEFSGKLKILLEDSVKRRLMSDVPYGAYLSGGVDSGIIVSLMKKHSPQKVKTFSVGFNSKEHSELAEAKFLADSLGTDHHELVLDEGSIKVLPEVIYHSDEPLADPTSIPIYFLSRYAKKYCTVILTGEGADEVFGGYPQYKFMQLHSKFLKKIPSNLRKKIPKVLEMFPGYVLDKGFRYASGLGEKGKERFAKFLLSSSFSEQYLNQIAIFNEEEQEILLNKKISLYKKYSSYFKNANKDNIINYCSSLDINTSLVEDLLMKVDKNTMAFGIEGRVPFLDHRVVELAATVPDRYKVNFFLKDKYLLRKSFGHFIPKQTAQRKKRHFFVPIDNWLKFYLKELKDKLLSEKYISKQKIFNYNYIKSMEENFEKSPLYYARQLWCLITFQIWYKQYVENERVKI